MNAEKAGGGFAHVHAFDPEFVDRMGQQPIGAVHRRKRDECSEGQPEGSARRREEDEPQQTDKPQYFR
jgi:hypothetical protein